MSDLLTISEYSKVRGCSVSAVYKRLKSPSNRIHDFVVRQGDQTFLKAEIIAAEGLQPLAATEQPPPDRRIEIDPPPSTTAPKPLEEVENPVEEGIGALAIRVLEQQLAQKDKEIEDLNRRLEEAARHEREISTRMAELVSQANELQRNNQILLAQAKQPQQIEAAPEIVSAPQEIQDPVAAAPEIQEKKPGFWKKIFGRNKG